MEATPSQIRVYRILGCLAVVHSALLFAILLAIFQLHSSDYWAFWVGLATLFFLWPLVLALHPGRSFPRLVIPIALAALLFVPSARFYYSMAPGAFGLPDTVTLSPRSILTYYRSYRAGRAEAERDLREDHLAVEEFGLPPPGVFLYGKMLQARYHVEIRRVAGCLVDEQIVAHAKGYNEISRPEIERRLGKDFWESAKKEATEYAQKHPTEL